MKIKRILAVVLLAAMLICTFAGAAYASETVTATGDVHVRTGPGREYRSLGVLDDGENISYSDETSYDDRGVAWYKVSYGSSTGWVSSKYAEIDADGYWGTCVEATTRVNVRSGPGVEHKDEGTLISGERIQYLGKTSYDDNGTAWYKASFYSNGTVWVSSAYSELVQGTPGGGQTGSETEAGSYIEATGRLNVRSGPGLSYTDKGSILKGETATYSGNNSTDERGVVWYKISFDGSTGWVSSRYCELY